MACRFAPSHEGYAWRAHASGEIISWPGDTISETFSILAQVPVARVMAILFQINYDPVPGTTNFVEAFLGT